jgi:Xaa-Pro aminopeptidase
VWDRVDQMHGFGGVRLEQNVLIGDDGCEVLTGAIPLAPVCSENDR